LGLFETGIVLSALGASATLLFTYRLLRTLFSPQLGVIVMFLLICNAYFFRYSYTTGNDMVFNCTTMAAIYWLLRHRQTPRWWGLVLLGFLAGLSYLTRYNGVVILAAIVVAMLIVNLWRVGWARRAVSALIVVAAFLAIITPWGLHCRAEKGSFFYNRNFMNVAYAFYVDNPTRAEAFAEANAGELDGFADVLAFDPPRFVAALPGRLGTQFMQLSGQVVTWPLALAALVGLAALFRRRPNRRQLSYYITGLMFFLSLSLVFFSGRFNLFLIPVFATLGVGAAVGVAGAASKVYAQRVAVILVAALLTYSAVVAYKHNRITIPGGLVAFRRMGEALVAQVPAQQRGRIVVARKPHFGYFAGLITVRFPTVESYDELMSFLRQSNADYLYFSYVAAKTRPAVSFLLDRNSDHPGLEPMMAGPVAVLYRVKAPAPAGP
jgi:4-amino-4-deoxy-L-arabinose transferase-like glycosyltransferase